MTSAWELENKYNEILEVPEELWPARDAAIEYAISGGPIPDSLIQLEHWFNDDFEVWQNLHSDTAAMQFDPAFDVNSTLYIGLDDGYLREHFDIPQDAQITDDMRIVFTRKTMEDHWDIDSEIIVGIGSRMIVASDGRACIVGYTEVFEGQGGIVCYFSGVFSDKNAWEDHLRKNGIHRFTDPNEIPDNLLLEIYNKANSWEP